MRLSLAISALICVCLAGCSHASSAPSSAAPSNFDQTKLEAVIPEMIRLIEAEDYVTLFRIFSTEEVFREMTNGRSLEDAVKEIVPFNPKFLEDLKRVKDVTPTMEDNGNKAIYILDENTRLHFLKQNGKWYPGTK